jgi:4-hydroxy-4-methyl-2-oxoglutarate aldolase
VTLVGPERRAEEVASFERGIASGVTSALVADALDALGRRRQALGPEIRAFETGVVIGRAFPVTVKPVDHAPPTPYVGLLRALDALAPGDVYVISTGGDPTTALWGELLSTAALARGAVAAVCDGPVRDTAKVRALGFPVFARGTVPTDINGRYEVVSHGQPVVINDVLIAPGDVIVADDDGVVICPTALATEVLQAAEIKAQAEDGFRTAVRDGAKPSEAFARYGVL